MQILMSTHNCACAGGAFWRAYPLACGLAQRGHNVTLLASRRPPQTAITPSPPAGVRVLEAHDRAPYRLRHSGLSPADIRERLAFVRQNGRWDVFHAFGVRPAAVLPGFALQRRRQIPFVLDWDDLWGSDGIAAERGPVGRFSLGLFDHFWERHVVGHADHVIAICHGLAKRAGQYGVANSRIEILPGGANLGGLKQVTRTDARRRHGIPDEKKVLFHCGFAPYDNELLRATITEITRRRSDVFFLLAGADPRHGSELLPERGTEKRFKHVGDVGYNVLGELYACADAVLLPFSDKPVNRCRFPNRLGDCMATGRPVLTNTTGDVGPIVTETGMGMAVESNAATMADAAERLLDDQALLEQMSRCARAAAKERFDWNLLAAKLEQIYRAACGG